MSSIYSKIVYPSSILPGVLWTPINTTAWYKADAITGLVDGATIATWLDSSGNSHTLTASGGTTVYKVGILNSLPIARFGTSALASGSFPLTSPCTVFVVGKETSAFLCWMADGLVESSRFVGGDNATSFAAGGFGQVVSSMASYAVMGGVFNGTTSVNSYNGTAVSGSGSAGASAGMTIGNVADAPMIGDIAEVVAMGWALSTSDRQTLEGYLAWKWGLQALLPGGHPYHGAAPTNTTFQPAYPMRHMPGFVFSRIGNDTESSAGYQQSITQFVRQEFEVDAPHVAVGQDTLSWAAFIQSAIQRVPFDFYPDASSPAFNTYIMMDNKSAAGYSSPGFYSIGKMTWKLLIP